MSIDTTQWTEDGKNFMIHADGKVYEHKTYSASGVIAQLHTSYMYITCPFCKDRVKAYVWSLAGGGKKCSCKAMFTSFGEAYKQTDKKLPDGIKISIKSTKRLEEI